MLLPRELIQHVPWPKNLHFGMSPFQLGLCGSPWHVAVASVCLCRCKRNVPVLSHMFRQWPTPQLMEASDVSLEAVLAPLGLQRQRARHIQQLSSKWYLESWDDLRDFKGVGDYVVDAVALFCFGNTHLTCNDGVLRSYAANYKGPSITNSGADWYVDGQRFEDSLAAYAYFAERSEAAV